MALELKIALIQAPLIWEGPTANRAYFSNKIANCSGVDIILLPEMFTTGFTMTPENLDREEGRLTLEWMQQNAKKSDAALIGSLPFYENGNFTNRLFFVKPNGAYHAYDKRHTFTLAGEDKVYNAGNDRLIVLYKDFRICPMVCYDLRFPVWARNDDAYDVVLYVANWPLPRINAWDTLLKARAIENLAYCIGLNRVGTDKSGHEYPGHSAVYDCLGERIAYSEEEEVVFATLSKEHITITREKLKFLDDRDQFTLLG
ncbi:amidohydrolase [Aggregatimonas sangjinii]|uniref:Omega-amidase YafV n=1 Tax=Aggregatimonas sangjinii TaxID=2583587 RepID=A0A5B7SXW7_9FLAO|nr:amidohydrolase [Aggregatimonas sangjinii]QCX02139.1 amidohydrolase [Aggregatimonas sangjinii]